MENYALYLWDVDGSIHVYFLGKNTKDRAAMIACRIMDKNHEQFVAEDNPCWQIAVHNGNVRIHLDD